MSDLLSSTDRLGFENALIDHFDTFKKPITIFKEAIVSVTDEGEEVFPGYGPVSDPATVTYIPVSGDYYALKVRMDGQNNNNLPMINTQLPSNTIRIKVSGDANAYIKEGKTIAVSYLGETYNQISTAMPKAYLGLTFYYYDLTKVE